MFAIKDLVEATIVRVKKTAKTVGSEVSHDIELRWRSTTLKSHHIDSLPGNLRDAFFKSPPTKDLPGIAYEPTVLRTHSLPGPHRVKFDCSDYMLTIQGGAISGKTIELYEVDVKNVDIEPIEGGQCYLEWSTKHYDLDGKVIGSVFALERRLVAVMLVPNSEQAAAPADDSAAVEKGGKKKPDKKVTPKDTKTSALPFKLTTGPDGGIVDRNPVEGQDKPDPTTAFVEAHAGEQPKTTH